MGMFDYVRCDIPLPDAFAGELQTKDFGCVLGVLLIRVDGRLMIQDCEWEEVPPEERSDRKLPVFRAINKRWRDLDFHGDFCFYGSGKSDGEWHEYVARFSHGTLESIKVIPEDAPPQFKASTNGKKAPNAATGGRPAEADRMIGKTKEDLTLGRKLDEIIAALPEDRRRKVEGRAAELIAEAARELDDFGAMARKGA